MVLPSTSTGVLVTVLILLSWLLLLRKRNQKQPKGPVAWPLIGVTFELIRNYHRMIDWITGFLRNSKTIQLRIPFRSCTFTVDPDNVEYILKTNFANFPKGDAFHSWAEDFFGHGIFNVDGDEWRMQRKTASVEFTSRNLRDFSGAVFRDCSVKLCEILAESARRSKEVDMQDLFMRMTFDSVCKLGFGVDVKTLDAALPESPFAKSFDRANEVLALRFVDPFWKLKKLLNLGSEAVMRRSLRVVDDFVYSVIRRRRLELQDAILSEETKIKGDILSRFMSLGNAETRLTNQNLRDVVVNFLVAGRDTTAVTLSWATYILAEHNHLAEKLHEELKSFEERAGKTNDESFHGRLKRFAGLLTYESLGTMKHLHAFVSEALRLYPAIPQDVKGVIKDDILPDGTKVKAGTLVAYVPYAMGRMEYLWGTDAAVFKPERWLENGVFREASPFKFTAFQAGPRMCLGRESAFLQMKMTVALLCRFFHFGLLPSHPVSYLTSVVLLMKNGLNVKVNLRP